MRVKPTKTRVLDCDRCGGVIHHEPAVVELSRPIYPDVIPSHDSYRFKLCRRCARKFFGWMGDAKEVKP